MILSSLFKKVFSEACYLSIVRFNIFCFPAVNYFALLAFEQFFFPFFLEISFVVVSSNIIGTASKLSLSNDSQISPGYVYSVI